MATLFAMTLKYSGIHANQLKTKANFTFVSTETLFHSWKGDERK